MVFFDISLYSLNLFSFMLGVIYGLSNGAFNRYKTWWVVVLYFAGVALYYAMKSGFKFV